MSSRAAALDEEYVSAHFLATYKGLFFVSGVVQVLIFGTISYSVLGLLFL